MGNYHSNSNKEMHKLNKLVNRYTVTKNNNMTTDRKQQITIMSESTKALTLNNNRIVCYTLYRSTDFVIVLKSHIYDQNVLRLAHKLTQQSLLVSRLRATARTSKTRLKLGSLN